MLRYNHNSRWSAWPKLCLQTLSFRTMAIAFVGLSLASFPQFAFGATTGPTPEGGPQGPNQGTAPQSDISTASTAPNTPPVFENYAIHGQSTFADQFHPGFHSAYRGKNSLDPGRRGNETWDVTLYAGFRPWKNAEVWVNPEVDQGFGISNSVGIAGYSSAEAYKVGAGEPYVRVHRVFFRQTLNLDGEVQGIPPDLNQLGGSQTANRLVFTVGKFGVVDVFDTNKYAHDARNDFMNWAVVDAGAFDYAADAWGYTYGASLEWYQNWWALRGGLFTGSETPNSKVLEKRPGNQFQVVVEAEGRYNLWDKLGKVKLSAFQTRAKLGRYSDLERYFAINPNASNIEAEIARRLRNKYGASLNVEQQIAEDLGFFLRASFNDGRTEAYDFTDIDRSVSLGFSMAGNRWGRPDDTVGIAGVINNISKARKNFFAQGGIGVLVGDGQLRNSGPEQILETYYSLSIIKGINISADYQFVNNPAYNRDRGPVHIFGTRLHAQF